MGPQMRRWPLFPLVAFLAAGLLKGGADLPKGWAVLIVIVPLVLASLQLCRPTTLGWRLILVSFCLLTVVTIAINLALAAPEGWPSVSAVASFLLFFTGHFGLAMWLLWLARPRRTLSLWRRVTSSTEGDRP